MTKLHDPRKRSISCRVPLLIAATFALAACTSTGHGPAGPERTESREAGGFRISHDVRADAATRGRFDQAVRLLENQEYQRGIGLLLEVTEAAPNAAAAYINLGMAYQRSDDLERAEESLSKALALDPRHPVAHNELGIVYRRIGRFKDARRSYEEALSFYESFHFARLNLAILCDVYLEDPGCALEHYQAYARQAPDDASVAMWIADLRSRSGR